MLCLALGDRSSTKGECIELTKSRTVLDLVWKNVNERNLRGEEDLLG